MKLSKTQQEVVDLMRDGWELGVSRSFSGRVWLQNGGCGRGGECKDVRYNTFSALRKAKIIVLSKESFPSDTYKLAEIKSA